MDLNDLFKAENAAELKSGKALGDSTLLINPLKLSASQALDYSSGGFTFSILPEAGLTVSLFNATTDEDPDGLINGNTPIISMDPTTDAYLKYALNVGATGSAGGGADQLSLDLSISKIFSTGFYKKHDVSDTVPLTITGDLSGFLSVFDWSSVEALNPGDTLFTSARGKLEGKLGFSWSDIFTKSLSALTKLLPTGLTLDLKISPSVSVDFSATIQDNYLCAMKRIDETQFMVTISKAKSSSVSGQIAASVGIEFANPDLLEDQLNDIVDQLVQSVTGYTGKVASLIQKFQTNTLSPAEKNILNGILERLKLTALTNPVDSLNTLIHNLETKARETASTIAKASASMSFQYEYSRISENQELLSVQISQALLKDLHPKLVGFKTDELLDKVNAKAAGITLNHYLNQESLTVRKSWGFGLSLMGKPIFSGKEIRKSVFSRQTNLQKQHLLSADQLMGYQRMWMGEATDWVTDFNARMPAFSSTETPSLNEFDFSFYVQMTSGMKVRKAKHLQQLLDVGVMWGAVDEAEVPRIIDKYLDTFKKQVVTAEAQLTFKPQAMLAMIQQLGQLGWSNPSITLMAQAMAASMSYWDSFPMRQSVSKRTKAYAPVWRAYLSNPQQPLSAFAAMAKQSLQASGASPMLCNKEGEAGQKPYDDFAANVMYQNPNTAKDARSFVAGLQSLKQGIANQEAFAQHFDQAYQELSQFFNQSFYVRTLGCLMSAFTQANPGVEEAVERVFTLGWGEGAEEQTVSLASKN